MHLHYENDSENINSTDINDTLEYEDDSLMDTSASSSRKRAGSDSENSDTNVTSSKKHNVSGRPATVSNEYKDDQNQNVKVVVVNIQSEKVNLGKINPIIIAKTINDLVCFVHKVQKTVSKISSKSTYKRNEIWTIQL